MLQSFESIVHASASELVDVFAPLRNRVRAEGEGRRTQLAQLLGLNPAQLVCGVGFNRDLVRVPDLVKFLGYPHREALLADRNYLFIHDRYRYLSVNNIVDIYRALGAGGGAPADAADLVISRLSNLEAQLEETINPVLIGGYKLEVRSIYENHLASAGLIHSRLDASYGVLRDITNEALIMLETGSVAPADFMRHPGVTTEEKSRAIFQRLVPLAVLDGYLAERPEGDAAEALRAARASMA